MGAANVDLKDLYTNGALRDAWIPLEGVKFGELKKSADLDNKRLQGSKPMQKSASKDNFGTNEADIPYGNLHLEINQAKDLVKEDIMGKSDPYAVVTYSDDKVKTKTVKNNQNPEWGFETDIPIDPNGPTNLKIEVFDDDKLAILDIPSILNNGSLEDAWIPLSGAKSGQIQVCGPSDPNDNRNNRKPSGSGGAKKLKGQLGDRKQSGGGEGRNDNTQVLSETGRIVRMNEKCTSVIITMSMF